MVMEETKTKEQIAQEKAEKEVNSFLEKYNFIRTFPLNFINLAEKMGGFKIYYLSDQNDFFNKAVGAFSPTAKKFALHPRFNKDKTSFLLGRYILAKLFARYALQEIGPGQIWMEMNNAFRGEEDTNNNAEIAAFAYELLMPAKEFKHQWKLLGHNIEKMSAYFEAPDFKTAERIQFLGLNDEKENCDREA